VSDEELYGIVTAETLLAETLLIETMSSELSAEISEMSAEVLSDSCGVHSICSAVVIMDSV
jgi:hypothetical protein